ncbi:methyl-accepting chemotaxis protein [Pelosinus sp. sgz500959]|uniref:methyl-accepting chemotaxis protein n=1 Tax=Pelosinus sp. sgz500959 TaxID=3242472 RepID=UPI00366E0CDA
MRVTIGKQILLVCMMVVIAFTGLNVYTYYQIDQIEKGYDGVLSRSVPLVVEVKDLNIELNNQAALVRGYILTASPQYVQAYDISRKNMDATLASLEKKLITPEGKEKVGQLRSSLDEYHKIADQGLAVRNTTGQEAATKFVAAAGAKVEVAEKNMNDTVNFLMDRMDLRVKDNVNAAENVQRVLGILDAIIFIVACIASIYLARRISGPLRKVADSAIQIANGNLAVNTIQYNAKDEIGDLLQAFTIMTDNLRSLVIQVAKSSEQVAASSEELTASSEQSAQAAGQVAESVMNVASGAAHQVDAVEQTISVVQEMMVEISQIASKSNLVSEKSGEAARVASSGSEAVLQATNQMQVIQNSVTQSAGVVKNLGERSQQIGQIVDVISGIAGQTNLLALNAAIEAARAGEQGRGFAVVADEVRKLAEQSHEAAQKISGIIRDIQSETTVAVTTMNQGTAEVARGTEVISATGDRFHFIVTMVQELNSEIKEIRGAAEKLSASSDDVTRSVDRVKVVAASSAADTQTISAAAEEQSASMEEIASSSQALSNMASELQVFVAKFHL